MEARSQRLTLGDFLRTRRERITPESVGISVEPRRRAKGLRREEVAARAHLSATWYAYLEQGRNVRASTEVLDNLARSLRLDLTEHRYLMALAAGPARKVAPHLVPSVSEIATIDRLVRTSDAIPFPVYAIDGRGALLAWNDAMPDWYGTAFEGHSRAPNIVEWLFLHSDARVRLADWHTEARDLVARIRYYFAINGYDDVAERMVSRIRIESPEADRWWRAHHVSEQQSRQRIFNHPRLGVTALTLLVMRPSISPAVSVIFHLPATDNAASRTTPQP